MIRRLKAGPSSTLHLPPGTILCGTAIVGGTYYGHQSSLSPLIDKKKSFKLLALPREAFRLSFTFLSFLLFLLIFRYMNSRRLCHRYPFLYLLHFQPDHYNFLYYILPI
ncbi:hypothetical protein BO82DRAFT_30925 [Aspergillus uvarum CBS 121591]|uniref:Uncharacterized protein n=1 Tax=Aspergillus uvarum CBS 121591 TaxID=1448315 RepID=A0A319CHY6_9EURO|nr:hypothetical protein BO82DRAFT_30925 [Aspergillus uvarum CBS 121591]PYH84040.1 hypothetical protein BO82DRAFT_30925 [Aspergillus uvarum CBS 121591]